MSNNATNNVVLMGAAVVGVLGAIGIFIAEQFYAEKRRDKLAQDVSRLNHQLASTRIELEHLKECMKDSQKLKERKRKHRRIPLLQQSPSGDVPLPDSTDAALNGAFSASEALSVISDTDYYTEYTSGDYESASEEFYDLSSDDDTTEATSSPMRNGRRYSKSKNSVADILSKADVFLKGDSRSDIKMAHSLLLQESCKANEAQNADILWRLGKCCYKFAKLEEDSGTLEERKRYVNEGIEHCAKALQADDKNSEVHKWYAILVGSQNDYLGNKEKIENGQIFIKHISEALKLNPQDGSLYHLSGRFKFEVSGLTWFERKMAAALFGEVPMATYEDALVDFYKAEELSDIQWKENRLLLAKCYIAKSEYVEAMRWLNLATEAPIVTTDDQINEGQIQKLIATYRSYV